MERKRYQVGFALPTVLITSIVMMIVLLSALTVASSVQASLRQNYYDRIARNAAESGSAYAEKCLTSGEYTENITITPGKNCNGVNSGNQNFVVKSGNVESTFSYVITPVASDDKTKLVSVKGSAVVTGKLGGASSRVVNSELKQRFSLEQDKDEVRATKRYWRFGKGAVLDFRKSGDLRYSSSGGTATALEGSTTVSDKNGNLLFWSDGITIYNKTNQPMRDGGGLLGSTSATQAVAAFPLDSQYNKIGVVSNTSKNETGLGRLYFSVVDMTQEGGLGRVVSKNQALGSGDYAQEGIGAMPSNRQGKFWVYTYNWDNSNLRITRFLVGSDGASGSAVTQVLSPGRPTCSDTFMGYGTFNFSDDYRKMLLYAGLYRCNNDTSGRAYIMNTNSKDGSLSLEANWATSASEVGAGYSADFSPNEKYVYVTNIYPGKLMRYALEDSVTGTRNNSTEIKNTEWVASGNLSSLTSYPSGASGTSGSGPAHQSGGQVLRGPDGRMYIADQSYLYGQLFQGLATNSTCYISVINKPNAENPGDISFKISGSLGSVTLSSNTCSAFGLPQMATVFEPKVVLY